LSPAIFLKAPLFEIPVPVRLKASAPIAIAVLSSRSFNSKAALFATVVPPAVVPSAVSF